MFLGVNQCMRPLRTAWSQAMHTGRGTWGHYAVLAVMGRRLCGRPLVPPLRLQRLTVHSPAQGSWVVMGALAVLWQCPTLPALDFPPSPWWRSGQPCSQVVQLRDLQTTRSHLQLPLPLPLLLEATVHTALH